MATRLKHWAQLATNAEYRRRRNETIRLRNLPEHSPTATDLEGRRIEILDAQSFLYTHGEIFVREIYRFESNNPRPLIIDGGANIGLSVIYFKSLFPDCRVIAFEPDPNVFRTLERNCQAFSFDSVELISKGLWSSETILKFEQEGSEAGRITQVEDDSARLISVPVVRLRDFLDQQVDLLKLDIEGAETEVLSDCADRLANVERIFVEYHSFVDKPQTLDSLLSLLRQSGFRLQVTSVGVCPHPFVERPIYFGMDLQLNIYGYRL